ncbi:hypothetical protein E7W39_10285 [Cronobacter sakazakii]|uniref:hypothetical protein n=1 Tax=Cronobacter sakazakii TaxID=28141 RepID=UPI001F511386|nr:hypothetical protein [Cronobacter sakazakii]MCI0279237.1 hypothetical protein [Cronobacter sakazakii]
MMTIDTAKLKAAAERQKSILAYIASYEPGDIDSDTVDLRFEDENGCDTGCDVSIVEECRRSADLIDELIAALEAAEKRVAELKAKLETADRLQDSAFRHGLQHGFSFGQTDNQAGFNEALSAYGSRGKQ